MSVTLKSQDCADGWRVQLEGNPDGSEYPYNVREVRTDSADPCPVAELGQWCSDIHEAEREFERTVNRRDGRCDAHKRQGDE